MQLKNPQTEGRNSISKPPKHQSESTRKQSTNGNFWWIPGTPINEPSGPAALGFRTGFISFFMSCPFPNYSISNRF